MKGFACTGTLTRIHKSLRADPFLAFPAALAGKPQPVGIRCPSCRKPVRRAYTSAQLTGWVFGFYSCSCTGLSQMANQPEPTAAAWSEAVAEAKGLARGAVKVRTAMLEDTEEAGGMN
jgi:hypothetical protein